MKRILKDKLQVKNIKYYIGFQIKEHIALEAELKNIYRYLSRATRDDNLLLTKFVTLMKKYPTTDSILLAFIDFLQLINSDNLLKQFDLDDINNLFKHMIKYHPDNFELHFEYFHFLYNILDSEKEAKKMTTDYIKRLNIKISKLEKLTQ